MKLYAQEDVLRGDPRAKPYPIDSGKTCARFPRGRDNEHRGRAFSDTCTCLERYLEPCPRGPRHSNASVVAAEVHQIVVMTVPGRENHLVRRPLRFGGKPHESPLPGGRSEAGSKSGVAPPSGGGDYRGEKAQKKDQDEHLDEGIAASFAARPGISEGGTGLPRAPVASRLPRPPRQLLRALLGCGARADGAAGTSEQ